MAAQTVPNRTAHNHSTEGPENYPGQQAEQQNGQPNGTHKQGEPAGDVRKQNGERNAPGWDQNPQLLQWRANVLLDEMMLGAVDITASEFTPTQSRPARNPNGAEPQPVDPYNEEHPSSRTAPAAEKPREPGRAPRAYSQETYQPESHADEEALADMGHVDPIQPAREPQDEWARPAWHFAEPTDPVPPPPPQSTATPAARAAILQEYTRAQTKPADGALSSRSGVTSRVPATPANGATAKSNADQWVLAAEQRYQKLAAPPAAPEANLAASTSSASLSAASWVDPTDALFTDYPATSPASQTSARYRLNQATRRSNLLPRMTTLDPHALQQEMVALQTEIEQALPTGHESRVRALHLLQKAYTLLNTDSSRSAEVDYYLQQVRTIGQRVQETLYWSNRYHNRLRVYLLSWVALSLIVLGSRYFYQGGLANAINWLSGQTASDSLLAHNVLTILAAFFAGALGGAIGAFINMHRYARSQQGFFDRKYSLRGLILPLIGGVMSLVLCVIFGLVYYLFRIDPALNLLLGALPAMVAFAFGIAQEFIYGTRS